MKQIILLNLFFLLLSNTSFGQEEGRYPLPWFREHLSSEEFHHRAQIPRRERTDRNTTHRPSVADTIGMLNREEDPRSFNQLRVRLWEFCYNSNHMNEGRAGKLGEHWKNDHNISRECWRILDEEAPPK